MTGKLHLLRASDPYAWRQRVRTALERAQGRMETVAHVLRVPMTTLRRWIDDDQELTTLRAILPLGTGAWTEKSRARRSLLARRRKRDSAGRFR